MSKSYFKPYSHLSNSEIQKQYEAAIQTNASKEIIAYFVEEISCREQYAHLSDSELLKKYRALLKTDAPIEIKANMCSEIFRRDISLDQ